MRQQVEDSRQRWQTLHLRNNLETWSERSYLSLDAMWPDDSGTPTVDVIGTDAADSLIGVKLCCGRAAPRPDKSAGWLLACPETWGYTLAAIDRIWLLSLSNVKAMKRKITLNSRLPIGTLVDVVVTTPVLGLVLIGTCDTAVDVRTMFLAIDIAVLFAVWHCSDIGGTLWTMWDGVFGGAADGLCPEIKFWWGIVGFRFWFM